jgi:GT2 family glycosyltransferase
MVRSIESILRQSLAPREAILVVDNNPALLARTRARFPDIAVIENQDARGTSGSRNSGVAVAQGAILAFMDEDAVAEPEWLERLCAPYADPLVAGVGGAILPAWQPRRPGWFPEEFDWVVGCTYRGMPETTGPVRNLIGCNMSLRRELVVAAGGFRTDIGRVGSDPIGCDETELCIRIRQRWPQRILLYRPDARVHHLVPQSRAGWSYFRDRCYAEGRSKAVVTRVVGAGDGLATERTYTLRTLPAGVWRSLREGGRGNRSGGARAAAIVAGFVMTAAGYLTGRLSGASERLPRAQRMAPAAAKEPVR